MKIIFLQVIACFITTCSFGQTISKTDTSLVTLRCVATLGTPQPLYVIDGVIAAVNNLDPSTIVTITILKDAEAAAIYGAAGAGGVIVITTKNKRHQKIITN